MSRISRILVPVDLGSTSEELLRYGIAWAQFFDSELHVLHVVSVVLPPPGVASVGLDVGARTHDWAADAQHSLNQLVASLPIDADRVHTAVRVGRPGAEIEWYAAEHHVDLIVMASHRHGAVARVALGSVAEQVVRKALCPVITVPPDVKIPHWLGAVDTMVLPIDLTDTSPATMRYARALANDLGATLHAIHVVAPPWERQLTYLPPAAVIAQMEQMTRVRADGTDPSGRLHATIRVGDAATTIEDYAGQVHADLIVMATHGRSTFAQIMLGGVTRKLLAHAPCPVLTLNGRLLRRREVEFFDPVPDLIPVQA